MSAQEILKLIEEVDPNDTAKLDEIDARVWCYIHGERYAFNEALSEHGFNNGYGGITSTKARKARKYTRSRDALKAIRPDGFWPIKLYKDCNVFRFELTNGSRIASSAWLETEELAELHAIIQAIFWDRENANA